MAGLKKIIILILIATQVYTQDENLILSNAYGNDFFIGFMRDIGGSLLATNLRLVIGTPRSRADGIRFVVEASGQLIYEGNVNSSSVVVSIPKRYQIVSSDVENRQKGIHVYTESQAEHIFVIVENFVETFTHGTFLAYPCGFEESNSFEYRIISTENRGHGQVPVHSEFLLIGCYNDTLVEIIPAQSVDLPINFQAQNDSGPQTETVDPGNSYHTVIHEMQTLLVLSELDLTGTMIISNKLLTVISGHECASVPSSIAACEPFAVQIPPVAFWGNKFLLAPFAGRTGAQFFKAVSSVGDANFSYICNKTAHIVQNYTLEINTSHYCYLEASKPAFVVQFSIGQGVDNRGDPAIAPISPIENYLHETEIVTLPFQANYISITVSAEHFDGGNNIKLDETNINCTWEIINDMRGATVGYGCSVYLNGSEKHYAKHSVRHFQENGLLSVLVYGFKFQEPIHKGYAYLAAVETIESAVEITESISSSFPLVYILTAIIAAVTVGIFGVLTVCCCYCKRRKQQQENTNHYEDLSEFSAVKHEDSLSVEPCIAYEGIQVIQKCPAYDVVSQAIQNDHEINTISKSANRDNEIQDNTIITGGPIYQCIDTKV